MTRVSIKYLQFILPLIAIFSFHVAFTQDNEAEKDTIIPLKLSNIPEQSIEVNEFINLVKEEISDPVFETTLEEAETLNGSTQKLIEQYQNQPFSETNLRELRIRLNDYHIARNQISETLGALEVKVDNFGSSLKKLNQEEEKWKEALATFDKDEQTSLSSLQEMANDVIDEIQTTKNELINQLNEALIIEKQLISVSRQTETIVSQIERKIVERKKDVFTLDSPPIWNIETFSLRQLKYSISKDIYKYFRSVVIILKNNVKDVFYYAVFFILLLTGLKYVKRYVRKVHEELKSQTSQSEKVEKLQHYNIFNRPFSITLVICLIIIINNEMLPVEIHELAGLVLIFPILLILKKHLSSTVFRSFIFVFLVFLFQKVSEISFYSYSFHRITNLLSSAALLFLILNIKTKIIRKWKAEHNTTVKKTLVVLANMTAILFLISFLSNFFGNVFLGESVLNATITSIYGGIVYYIAYLIITQLFELFSMSVTGQKSNILKRSHEKVAYYFSRIVGIILTIIWISSVIDYYRLNEFYDQFTSYLFEFSVQLGDITIVPANIVVLFIVIFISFQISKFVRLILEDEVLSRVTLPRGVPGTISMLTRYSVLFIGFIIAILAAGIELDKMAIVLGGLSVGIGFGLQNIFSNFVSGLILAFERPIKSGDVIQMTDLFGEVKEIGIRASTVRTFDGAEVIVPNSNLVSNEVINWTLSDKHRRIEVKIGVAYGTDPEVVLDILKKVADDHSSIMKIPEPNALFLGFGDSSLDFRMLVWTNNIDEWLKVQSQLHVAINSAIKAAGIEIPFPQRDLHVKTVGENVNFKFHSKRESD